LSKAYLLSFYKKVGFKIIGPSHVEHGRDQWYELSMDLDERRREVYTVDAFATRPFHGNTACVIFQMYPEKIMQSIATELSKPVTVFVSERVDTEVYRAIFPERYDYDIRWFGPKAEIKLCGHGTLAATYALYQSQRVPPHATLMLHSHFTDRTIVTEQKGSSQYVHGRVVTGPSEPNRIEMSFAARPAHPYSLTPEDMAVVCSTLMTNNHSVIAAASAGDMLVLELHPTVFHSIPVNCTFSGFRNVSNQFQKVILTCAASKYDTRWQRGGASALSVIGTEDTASTAEIDFYSRCVLIQRMPGAMILNCEIAEDAVTGSAHIVLASYWRARLVSLRSHHSSVVDDYGIDEPLSEVEQVPDVMVGYQRSRRGGLVMMRIKDDNVFLSGSAILVAASTLSASLII
jgi:predicted PhzF superfamily epimerase YddE/YHI9